MWVSCLFRLSCYPQALSLCRTSESSLHPSLCIWHICRCVRCVCRWGLLWRSQAWKTAILFLGGLSFPSGGPHWWAQALSISPFSGPGSPAKHDSAGLADYSTSMSPVCWSWTLYKAHHPVHYTTHRCLDCLLALIATGVQQVDHGHPIPSLKTDTLALLQVLCPWVCSKVTALTA